MGGKVTYWTMAPQNRIGSNYVCCIAIITINFNNRNLLLFIRSSSRREAPTFAFLCIEPLTEAKLSAEDLHVYVWYISEGLNSLKYPLGCWQLWHSVLPVQSWLSIVPFTCALFFWLSSLLPGKFLTVVITLGSKPSEKVLMSQLLWRKPF